MPQESVILLVSIHQTVSLSVYDSLLLSSIKVPARVSILVFMSTCINQSHIIYVYQSLILFINIKEDSIVSSSSFSGYLGLFISIYSNMFLPICLSLLISIYPNMFRVCPRGVMVKAMEFVLQSRYCVHFRANALKKGMNPLIFPTMG